MSNQSRYIWLAAFILIGTVLSIGAWEDKPGEDPDNQAGYVIVLLMFLILLFIYVPVAMRSLGALFRRSRRSKSE